MDMPGGHPGKTNCKQLLTSDNIRVVSFGVRPFLFPEYVKIPMILIIEGTSEYRKLTR